ncbi:MAG: InlB B-repeat-containing protein, partial [Prevotellaceae bacterium]|nr:InlB B-repeat-containing protein [Prevotellaceae bacterium]
VTFEVNGGSSVSAQEVKYNGAIVRPADPKKSSYTFAGWWKDAGFTTPWNFSTDVVTGNVTLYAKWIAGGVITYTVNFSTGGGSAVDPQTVEAGGKVALPANPVKTGYTFEGWYTNEAFATRWDFSTGTVTAAMTLYARWTKNNTCTVTFNSNGGSSVNTQEVTYNGTVTRPADPTKSGYTLEGWYSDNAYTSAWEFGVNQVTRDTTLYAKWSNSPTGSVTISFKTNGGDTIPPQQVQRGDKISKPDKPTRDGYTFDEWYEDEAFKYACSFSHSVSENTTLYARWISNNLRPDSVMVTGSDGKWAMATSESDSTKFSYEMSCGDTSTAVKIFLKLHEGVESTSGDTLTIPVPEGAFRRSIPITIFTSGNQRKEESYTLTLERRFEFNSIVHVQLGGRMLMVINNSEHNGGYHFKEAQWAYKDTDGNPHPAQGTNNKFYYISPTSSTITESMYVRLQDSTGTWLQSCLYAPPATSGAPRAARTSVYPNPVAAGGVVHLSVAVEHYDTYRLLDVLGSLQRAGSAAELQKGLTMPGISGVYFLTLEGKTGKATVQIAVGKE